MHQPIHHLYCGGVSLLLCEDHATADRDLGKINTLLCCALLYDKVILTQMRAGGCMSEEETVFTFPFVV